MSVFLDADVAIAFLKAISSSSASFLEAVLIFCIGSRDSLAALAAAPHP